MSTISNFGAGGGLRPDYGLDDVRTGHSLGGGGAQGVGTTGGSAPTAAPEPKLHGDLAANADLQAVFRGEKTLGFGDRSDAVKLIQQELYRAGYDTRGIDGQLGRGTESALSALQRKCGLPANGRLDRETLLKLQEAPMSRVLPSPSPLTQAPASYLKTADERTAYANIEKLLWTGSSWGRGIDLAVTNEDAKQILDILDKLPSKSYANVLHGLAATKHGDPLTPTLLDKMIRDGTSQTFNVRLSHRFCQQLTDKLGNEPEPDRKVLSHISPDNVDKLKGWASWNSFVNLFS